MEFQSCLRILKYGGYFQPHTTSISGLELTFYMLMYEKIMTDLNYIQNITYG